MIGILKGLYTTGKHMFRRPFTFQYPDEKRVLPKRFRGLLKLHGMIGESGEVNPCNYMPPCTTNCPSNVDARGQNILVAKGKFEEAYELVASRNTMPGALGRICHHPCESVCRRGHYDGSVSIRNLHRFISDYYINQDKKPVNVNLGTKSKSVGIIGGGPAGLTAARDLALKGYGVTIYEKGHVAGGALASGIPKYRLPKDVLQKEIENVKSLGVEIKTGMEAGKDFQLDDLTEKEGHSVVLIAVGLQISRGIPIPGTDLDGVLYALPFLADVNFDRPLNIGKKVVVVGGGNVAIDVARCAIRAGYKEVNLACLESFEEMPAHRWEIDEAVEEGVILHNSVGPREILNKEGRAGGLKFVKCERVFDDEGKFNPQFCEDEVKIIDCDTVILSIGQGSDLEFLKRTKIKLNERGQLMVDKRTMQTSARGVFACGEVMTGPGSAIAAIAGGHDVAESIDKYLSGKEMDIEEIGKAAKDWPEAIPGMRLEGYDDDISGDKAFPAYSFKYPTALIHERIGNFVPMLPKLRQQPKFIPADTRKLSYEEFELALSREQAVVEGWRCLRCETKKCVLCGICASVCPVNALELEVSQTRTERKADKYQLDVAVCTFCGICEENCPTQALYHSQEFELAQDSREKLVFQKEALLDIEPKEDTLKIKVDDNGFKKDDVLGVGEKMAEEIEEAISEESITVKTEEKSGDTE